MTNAIQQITVVMPINNCFLFLLLLEHCPWHLTAIGRNILYTYFKNHFGVSNLTYTFEDIYLIQ